MNNFKTNKLAWCLTDGSAGMISQVRGLAEALNVSYELKEVKLNFPWNKLPVNLVPLSNKMFKNLGEFSLDGKVPDILDNAFVILDFKNGIRSSLELCMFAENSEMQEELCVVGDKGKIETGVPSDASGKNSSEIRIGLRDSKNAVKKLVEVDKKILAAGQHHGSTYYQHMEFIKSINNNLNIDIVSSK